MGLDFDLNTFCDNLKATKPPYECPFPDCGKVYKSYSGIQFHIYNFDHDNPDGGKAGLCKKKGCKKGGGRGTPNRCLSPASLAEMVRSPARPEPLTYAEAQRMVEVELQGQIYRINIHESLEIISQDEIDNCDNTEKEEKPEKENPQLTTKDKKEMVKLPEASYKVLSDYVKPVKVPPRPSSYYRYIERSLDELDEEVEYDMDEEDFAWLEILNERRKKEKVDAVAQSVFEQLMDRFEKEAHFQSQSNGADSSPAIDEDAVCSICVDGECQNTNVILFCDMCNLAVHQECYGVPYIPEGQWLCRRCLQSPSRAVKCCLCPNKGGAFKQTSSGRWAHVVCALWIPEVAFANIVFLEPIDNVDRIPAARWKLSCYICKQRGTGACIQCHKTNCYTAFHVTCAQQAGLYMKIEPVQNSPGGGGGGFNVRKTAFCDVHCPPDGNFLPMMDNGIESDDEKPNTVTPAEVKEKSRIKMRQARKILAEKRNATPIVSIPVIPDDRIAKITSTVAMPKKVQFVNRLQSYWALKRQSRNGVPLLRRLQSTHMSHPERQTGADSGEANALKAQLKYWQRLRQDLEKARLLVELIRKREKLKREQLRLHQMETEMKLQPLLLLLRETLLQLRERDSSDFFSEPVSLDEVPDYVEYIKQPMDFNAMEKKMESHEYVNFEQFSNDFDLIVSNCMKYNAKETVFYKAALKLRDQGGAVIRAGCRTAEKIGFDSETGLHTCDAPKVNEAPTAVVIGDRILSSSEREHIPLEEQLNLLLDRLDETQLATPSSTPHQRKSRLAKRLKREITIVRHRLALQKGLDAVASDTTQDTDTQDEDAASPPPPSPVASPSKRESSDRLSSDQIPQSTSTRGGRGGRGGRGRGRGRGRWIRPAKVQAETTSVQEEEAEKEVKVQPPPTGVNRRTAVLLNSKKGRRSSSSHVEVPSASQQRRGRPPKNRKQSESEDVTNDAPKKRSSSAVSESENSAPPAKKSAVEGGEKKKEGLGEKKKDSFLSYRSFAHVTSDGDSSSQGHPSDTDLSDSDSSSADTGSDSEDGGPGHRRAEKKKKMGRARTPNLLLLDSETESCPSPQKSLSTENMVQKFVGTLSPRREKQGHVDGDPSLESEGHGRSNSWSSTEETDTSTALEPLDLVWAKCRGYPWYPALLINPKMPRTGYFHNGVPIPVPPEEVLLLQAKYDIPVFLVLFFDAKRTWQWLPRNKLELLGIDVALDKSKLAENKKPNVKKAVRKAYIKAILHQCKVTGQPNPLDNNQAAAAKCTEEAS